MLTWLAVSVIVCQSVIMLVDEMYFHRRRVLPRWERIGHPLDTLTVLLCYALTLALPPSPLAVRLFAGFAVFSCLFVTKDEFVHARECRPLEQWLHALLFVLHPVVLAGIALLWIRHAHAVLLLQAGLTLSFGLYQAVYWNLSWAKSSIVR